MSGYIGNIPTPQATQSRQSFTATASQTTFATVGYTAGFIDVYLNGVHLLDGTDYTATNGSDIVLTTGAALNDVVEFVAYETFSVLDQSFTGTTTTEALTTTGAFTSLGIDDNATSTAMTLDSSGNVLVGKTGIGTNTVGVEIQQNGFVGICGNGIRPVQINRQASDGDIVEFRKDGTTVGSIGTYVGFPTIGKADTGLLFQDGANAVHPWNIGTNGASDGVVDLGTSSNRFKDLTLSGGVYLGGTGAANKLDDYEEGTWTPVLAFGGASVGIVYDAQQGMYTKVGNLVTVSCYIGLSNKGTSTGTAKIANLPFTTTSTSNSYTSASLYINQITTTGSPLCYADIGSTTITLVTVNDSGLVTPLQNTNFINTSLIMISLAYRV